MRKLITVVVGVLVVLVAAGVVVWFVFVKTDAKPKPKEVATPTQIPAATSGANGTWTVVAGTDAASGDDAKTFVGYRVQENLFAVDQTATGRTPNVTGSMKIDGRTVSDVSVVADLTTLTSDQSRRDNAIRDDGLETNRFPTARFELTTPVLLPEDPVVGKDFAVKATGDLTLHGVTRSTTIELRARWDGKSIHVFGTLPVQFSDYGITAPNRPGISVEDRGDMDVNLWFGQKSR